MTQHLSTAAVKLTQLRELMQQRGIDAWVLMSADPHLSEYLPEHWKIRQWLTGFTGSVGTVVVTADQAGLWVDGRYWVQAEQQLHGTGFSLQKQTPDPNSSHLAWLEQQLAAGATIAVDGRIISVQQFDALQHIALKNRFELISDADLISPIWQSRPDLPAEPVWEMQAGLNALTRAEKIEKIRQHLADQHIHAHFISALDDIAWILNCRGSDVDYNPVFLAHLYIDAAQVVVFIDSTKVSAELKQILHQDQIQVRDYAQAAAFLNVIHAKNILIDPNKVSVFHQHAIAQHTKVRTDINPSTLFKSQKHPSELAHIRQAMLKDGIALCHFFQHLEDLVQQKQPVDELQIDTQITAFRAQQPGFMGPSFATIAGFNANGALPHYRATPEHYAQVEGDGLLLIDSGGQYVEGTTDITRVVPIGQPSQQQKHDYTLVLKSHIALARAVFPEALAAPLLDAIARQPLWQHGLDYRHGTGHGVGFALNVHEGPQVLSYYAPVTPYSALLEGMIVSNEPGLYHAGQYGIRIENLVAAQVKATDSQSYGQFLAFETLTLCPIHQHCILIDLLDEIEIEWLNQYHQLVREQLAPHLAGEVLNWLLKETQPLSLEY